MARKKTGGLSAAAKLLGKKGGKAGGPARAQTLTKAQRTEIARKGGVAKNQKMKK